MEQIFHRSTFLGADKIDAEDAEEHTHSSDEHRRNDSLELQVAAGSKSHGTQGSSREDGAAVGLVEVGTHAGHVAHIVANIIGNSGRIARIVLGDVGFDLAHNVGSHVGSFRVDATTHTSKERLRRGTHAEGQHGGGDGNETVVGKGVEHHKPDSDVEQAETYDGETHHGT